MSFTGIDVSSLSRSLTRWEWTEYIFEGAVVLACLGELIADVGEKWLGEHRKTHLERWSTVVLILALAVSLTALVRTNELSGFVIGSLGDKADEANSKALTALSNAAIASSKAASALTDSGTAKTIASGASTASAKVESRAEDALKTAADAQKEADTANEQLADRKLSDAQQLAIAQILVSFAGQEYKVVAYWDSQESLGIANRIHQSLQAAHWTYLPPPSTGVALMGGIVGVQVWHHPDADESTKEAAKLLTDSLNNNGILAYEKVESPTNNPKDNIINLSVGSKR